MVIDSNSVDICSKKLVPLGIRAEPIGVSFGDQAREKDLLGGIRDSLVTVAGSPK